MRSCLPLAITIFGVALAVFPEKCNRPPPRKPSGVECCENFQSVLKHSILDGCEKLMPETEKDLPRCELFVCALKNVGVVGTDNKVDKTKVKNFLNENFSGEWVSVAIDAADKCFTEMESLKYSCEAQTFSMCFLRNQFRSCPEKRWKNIKECNDSRDYMAECAEELMYLNITV